MALLILALLQRIFLMSSLMLRRVWLIFLAPIFLGYNRQDYHPHKCMFSCLFFFQAEDGIRLLTVTGVQTCALPISLLGPHVRRRGVPRALEIIRERQQ